MATQSILKNIVITEPKTAEIFIEAMERASTTTEYSYAPTMKSNDLSKEELKNFFGVIKI